MAFGTNLSLVMTICQIKPSQQTSRGYFLPLAFEVTPLKLLETGIPSQKRKMVWPLKYLVQLLMAL